jgi:hypothetical protein
LRRDHRLRKLLSRSFIGAWFSAARLRHCLRGGAAGSFHSRPWPSAAAHRANGLRGSVVGMARVKSHRG